MNTSGDVENSDDDSESLLSIVLSEAASGLVNLVVIDNHSGSYVGQVLKVLVHDDTLIQNKDFLIAWDRFRTAQKLSLEALIALSRPLRDDLFSKPDRELKLVARSGLWEPLNLHAAE